MVDTKLPLVGNVPKPVLIGSVVTVAGVGGYVWWKHKKMAASAPSVTSGAAAAYGYGYGYGAYGYNVDQELADEELAAGGYGYGGYGYGISGVGSVGLGVGSPVPPVQVSPVASTNAEWAQAAETYFANNGIYDATTAAAALGKYITGGTLSANQQAVVQAAIGVEGYPPTAGTNNFPPNMHSTPPVGQPKPGNPKVAQHTISAPGGQDLNQIFAANGVSDETKGIKVNPSLRRKYYGTRVKVPKGTRVVIPAH